MSTRKKNIVVIETDECKGCERCINACPKSVLELSTELNKYGYPYAFYTGDGCIGCGSCFYTCPEPGAVTIIEEEED